ncbi:uncharacterized protein PFL1_02133 [Pseudozyma flocculosa PF-1]|uniref:Uncharacterized protein n=1 Tax=Pseudozyma flocculosa TaxID=84751 RepID=A0A5C3EZJ5_9BASI|nr:uncharacterized protein PFL1_02133 [Pseudozyma flocculosa PF-1]EPQ30609.1 hypothetical protein PFL1_02133 [Pseudozyma flocculosa PF-1]SPO37703.1 uncharacterized protein PSFLO_03179 [Pseudozyma flocculosa]
MQVISHTSLSFSRLVRYLSRPHNLPSALHTRNTLLSAYCGQELYPPAADRDVDDAARWRTLVGFLNSSAHAVTAVGPVPREVLVDAVSNGTHAATGQDEPDEPDGPWGLIVTAMRWKMPAGTPKPPRIQIWLNPRPPTSTATEHEWQQRRRALATWIFAEWLPQYARAIHQAAIADPSGADASRPREATNGKVEMQSIVFSGMERYLVDLCRQIIAQDGPAGGRGGSVQWENPCFQFLRRVEPDRAPEVALPDEWHEGPITEDDVELVRSSNKLAFPIEMVRSRVHISVLLRHRGDGHAGQSRAMGWAYTHEDLSIGSLNVVPEYRRSKAFGRGVGATVVARLEPKIVAAARAALEAAGVAQPATSTPAHDDAGPFDWTPCCAMVEEDNAVSRAFFTRLGYQQVLRNSWIGIQVPV